MVKNSIFLELLAHPLELLGQSGWLYARICAGLCPTYATALDAAEENRKGRRLSRSRHNPQNWYYVINFLAHPVEPRDRWSKHMRHLDRGEIKLFSIRCLYASIFDSF